MIRLTQIFFAVAVLSFIYGHVIMEHTEFSNIYTFHIPMIAFDAIAIALIKFKPVITVFGGIAITFIRSKPIKPITDILCVLVGLSIVNHGFGGYAWASEMHDLSDTYDFIRPVIFALEILVLVGGWYARISSKRPIDVTRPSDPGILVVERNKADNLCN